MGNYVLYLLMQAFVTMILAYFAGTRVLERRVLPVILPAVGLYLLMGSSLVEVWGDRAGWTAWAIGGNAALVTIAVALVGAGALLGAAPDMERSEAVSRLASLFAVAAVALGVTLAATGGGSEAVVDPTGMMDAEISGGFRHLGVAGWAMGTPLFIGAALASWMGARTFVVRGRTNGAWLVCAGGLFLVWPLDPWFAGLPLAPAILIFAVSTVHFGLQNEKEGEAESASSVGGEEAGVAPWVREALDANGEGPGTPGEGNGADETPERGTGEDTAATEDPGQVPPDGE